MQFLVRILMPPSHEDEHKEIRLITGPTTKWQDFFVAPKGSKKFELVKDRWWRNESPAKGKLAIPQKIRDELNVVRATQYLLENDMEVFLDTDNDGCVKLFDGYDKKIEEIGEKNFPKDNWHCGSTSAWKTFKEMLPKRLKVCFPGTEVEIGRD